MSEPLISVIVPIYKVEAYLNRCIESIMNQTYRNLEIILVDDGSPDNCGEICNKYAREDSRIRVIRKSNGGLSSARNAALDIARGELIGFVDGDDWIEPDMYEFLYRNLEKEAADVSVCGRFDDYVDRSVAIGDTTFCKVCTRHEAMKLVYESEIGMYMWNKLFRREVFSTIRFPVGKVFEDIFIMFLLIDAANKVIFSLEPKYHYLQRHGSIVRSPYKPETAHRIEATWANYEYVSQRYPTLKTDAKEFHLIGCVYVLDKMLMSKTTDIGKEKKELIRYIRKNWKEIWSHSKFGILRKLAIMTLFIHESLYKAALYMRKTFT